MPWIQEFVEDAICGGALGVVKGLFGVSIFTAAETEEIHSLKKLALSVVEKAPDFTTDALVCEGIRKGQKAALNQFADKASPEMIAAGVVTAAELVCAKSFKARFASVLTGACLNLVGC